MTNYRMEAFLASRKTRCIRRLLMNPRKDILRLIWVRRSSFFEGFISLWFNFEFSIVCIQNWHTRSKLFKITQDYLISIRFFSNMFLDENSKSFGKFSIQFSHRTDTVHYTEIEILPKSLSVSFAFIMLIIYKNNIIVQHYSFVELERAFIKL